MTVGNFRNFAGKMYRIVRQSPPPGPREFSIKREAQEKQKQLKKKGVKTRIVSSSNVSKYGGDIAYFLFKEMETGRNE